MKSSCGGNKFKNSLILWIFGIKFLLLVLESYFFVAVHLLFFVDLLPASLPLKTPDGKLNVLSFVLFCSNEKAKIFEMRNNTICVNGKSERKRTKLT